MHWQEIHVLIGEIVLYGITGRKLNCQYEVDQKLFIISYIHLYRLVINNTRELHFHVNFNNSKLMFGCF